MSIPWMVAATALLLAVPALASQEKPEEGWKHRTARVNGIQLHYVEAGEGQTVLFLHGFPEFWYAWKDQLRDLGRDHHAVAVDMRGYNLSDKPEAVKEYALPILVEDVKALLDQLRPGKKAVLVGHDWGGVVAWAFAMAHPESLEKLVIINAPHPVLFARELRENPAQQRASTYMDLFKSPMAEATLSGGDFLFLSAAVFGSAKPGTFTDEDKKRYKEAWSQPRALTGGLNYYRASGVGPPKDGEAPAFNPPPAAPLKVPTLVLWGEKDTALLPSNLNGLDAAVPGVKIVRIPEGTHWVVHEEPERVNREIREFISGK